MVATQQTNRRWTSHLVEHRSIEYVPPDERHGRVRDQFTVWTAANATALNIFFGSLAILLGLNFVWAIVAIVVGTVVGALMTSLHALQGPKLGLPQLLQSRAQFGYYGAVIFFLGFIVVEFGFMASQLVIQAYSMHQVVPAVSIPVWAFIAVIPVTLIAIFGYDWVHRWQRWATILLSITAVVMLIQALTYHGHLAKSASGTTAPPLALFLVVTVIFIINIAGWAPNVSDYSRYLPENVRFWPVFWAVFLGNVLPTIAFAIIGAYITGLLPAASLYGAVQHVSGDWALVIMAISLTGTNVFNTYTGMLSMISTADTFAKVKRTLTPRVIGIVIMVVAALLAAVLGYHSFLDNFVNFLDVLIFIFFPWSAINLADFYLVRHGHYEIPPFFERNGPYGLVQAPAAIVYVVGLVVELLFVNQTYFTGPLVKYINGVDISWILGFFVPFVLYAIIGRATGRTGRTAGATPASPAVLSGSQFPQPSDKERHVRVHRDQGQAAAHNRHRVMATPVLVPQQHQRGALLHLHDRQRFPRAVSGRDVGGDQRPGAGRAGHPDQRRLSPGPGDGREVLAAFPARPDRRPLGRRVPAAVGAALRVPARHAAQ
jgi:nucleobase:cation symporter-1, NCS1 family